ncbi:proline oxidase [Salpingoeca rosetta]|uniref:Proline dehydrogenase n=1 Tax=Salpingoeca rosetta (strain ATCC 50818 / BSB-021) TaxID=946362 RepID=F2UPP5_SALR5|nr:proline oxidase [Salpingoeca rosetta]EGD79600.1 proline oxidase [Salpingoeca rosetta]|eukprot:XP_004988828.1 proline oxidase [Salpingoeca rosetta]
MATAPLRAWAAARGPALLSAARCHGTSMTTLLAQHQHRAALSSAAMYMRSSHPHANAAPPATATTTTTTTTTGFHKTTPTDSEPAVTATKEAHMSTATAPAAGQAPTPAVDPTSAPPHDTGAPAHATMSADKLDFSDPSQAFQTKSLYDLVLAYGVLKLCTVRQIVENAGPLYKKTRAVFGARLVDGIVKGTFFRHFCAGENEDELRPIVAELRASGIGSIMDYAAEADLEDKPEDVLEEEQRLSARTYDYIDESHCDANVENFKTCIENVHNVTPAGIAAIKVTALGHPDLLKQLSTAIIQTQWLFDLFAKREEGVEHHHADGLTEEDFQRFFHQYFPDISDQEIHDFYNLVDSDRNGRVDFVEWTHNLHIEDIWELMRRAGPHTPLAHITHEMPTERELELLRNLQRRLTEVVEYAEKHRVRLMIDAEQTYFQPIIDNLVLGLQRKYNKVYGLIYQTYQCYLKDAVLRITHDLERAQREGWWFAAKLVRGAYMEAERKLAEQRGYPDPIHDTIEDTHAAYNRAIQLLMDFPRCNVLIASHNQDSVEFAVEEMKRRGIDPQTGGVCFAQLRGMSDHLTYTLGLNGYKAYKYVPYGPVNEVMPYLIRRAHENSGMLGGASHELTMISNEIKRRIKNFQFA